MNINYYYPILKTTISEIRALRQITPNRIEHLCPIFELTKSRKTKNDSQGDVFKRVNEIEKIMGGGKFMLDLTSEESLSNSQIESMFDDTNNFENWCEFVKSLKKLGLNVSPVIQAYDDSSIEELNAQMHILHELCGEFTLRIKQSYFDMGIAINLIKSAQKYKFNTLIDVEYVDEANLQSKHSSIIQFCTSISENDYILKNLIICSSSFPAMVNHNGSFDGSIPQQTAALYKACDNSLKLIDVSYGDYGSVHPFRNDITAYNWVPRIDFPLKSKVIFYRKQRERGGYKDCATRLVTNAEFISDSLTCWGVDEINDAVSVPNGKSPSYWISVRINIHISRIIDTLSH